MKKQEITGHGGSRPVTRSDDGRTQKQPGETKLFSMRFENEDELGIINQLTPRERSIACIGYEKDRLQKVLQIAANEVYQNEVVDTLMEHVIIGLNKDYPDKEDWIWCRISEWQNEATK